MSLPLDAARDNNPIPQILDEEDDYSDESGEYNETDDASTGSESVIDLEENDEGNIVSVDSGDSVDSDYQDDIVVEPTITSSDSSHANFPVFPHMLSDNTRRMGVQNRGPSAVAYSVPPVPGEMDEERAIKRPRLDVPLNLPNFPAGEIRRSQVAGPSKHEEDIRCSADECIICMDVIMSHGEHRAACLACGHIFGQECIRKWLRTNERDKRLCPQCKAKAREADIRPLYTAKTTLCVMDNSEIESARSDLVRERQLNHSTKEELNRMRTDQHMGKILLSNIQDENRRFAQENMELKRLVEEYKRQTSVASGATAESPAVPFRRPDALSPVKNRPVNLFLEHMREYKDASARVMAYCSQQNILVLSQKLNAAGHGPFGKNAAIRLVSCVDVKISELLWLPIGMIKDVSVNNATCNAVIGAMDKSIALVSLSNKAVIHKFQDDLPVWSCAWNTDDDRYFYTGLADGSVSVYDIRNLSGRVARLVPPTATNQNNPPIFQLHYVDRRPSHKFSPNGLLVSSLTRCGFFKSRTAAFEQFDYSEFPRTRNSPHFAVTYDPSTRLIARSYRPEAANTLIHHSIEELNFSPGANPQVYVNSLHTVSRSSNGVSMYRGGFLSLGNQGTNDLRFAAADESQKALLLWDLMDRNPKQTVKTPSLVWDVCQIRVNDQPRTVALMENGFQIYSTG